MKQEREASPVTVIIGTRVKELRTQRGLSAQKLSDRCVAAGAPKLQRQVISNLETGRRGMVDVAELLILAYVLDTSPLSLLLPADGSPVPVTDQWQPDTVTALAWITGLAPMRDTDIKAWKQGNTVISRYRAFREVFEHATWAEVKPDERDFPAALREVARAIEAMTQTASTVPALPAEWIKVMDDRGWLTDASAIPVQGDDDGRR